MMLSLMPLPLGRLTQGLLPLPMVNTLPRRVANWWPRASSTWMVSKLPLCFSLFLITPTRPVFLPPVTMTTLPTSNLMKSTILLVSRSILIVSFALMIGSG
ncbi:Os02g0106001 [Oryza sativa Japonica Group]|uniref:Os02g0106001 protein n=1 Tax=Oryza sativa subsp. japonica TaxID=39947 RepID=A0A0P0VDN4_ORYSJ|nr:hypothetical protein EE612_008321 [Oryza sativa]BAS76565.1 Os02g0106001 [Oryza sativa Japonica Group]